MLPAIAKSAPYIGMAGVDLAFEAVMPVTGFVYGAVKDAAPEFLLSATAYVGAAVSPEFTSAITSHELLMNGWGGLPFDAHHLP